MEYCPRCNAEIIVNESCCEHFNQDDLIEYSGKLMSDNIPQVQADWMAIKVLQKVVAKGMQGEMF